MAGLLGRLPGLRSYQSRERFFEALAFNYAIGATDGHAKNYSLLLSGNDVLLAPLYDVNSALPYTRPYGHRYKNVRKLHSALRVSGESAWTRTKLSQWADVAEQLSLNPSQSLARLKELVRESPVAVDQAYRAIAQRLSLPQKERTPWIFLFANYHENLHPSVIRHIENAKIDNLNANLSQIQPSRPPRAIGGRCGKPTRSGRPCQRRVRCPFHG